MKQVRFCSVRVLPRFRLRIMSTWFADGGCPDGAGATLPDLGNKHNGTAKTYVDYIT